MDEDFVSSACRINHVAQTFAIPALRIIREGRGTLSIVEGMGHPANADVP